MSLSSLLPIRELIKAGKEAIDQAAELAKVGHSLGLTNEIQGLQQGERQLQPKYFRGTYRAQGL